MSQIPTTNYGRRRIAVLVIALVVVAIVFKLITAGWGFVQDRWEASNSVTPSNPISQSPTSTHKVHKVPACADSDISVAVILDANSNEFAITDNVIIHATITNTSQTKCLRDVGSKANEIAVFDSADKQVWSSDTCHVKQVINLVELQPGDIARVTLTWGGNVDPHKCGKNAAHVPVGDYTILAMNGKTKSEPLPITFLAATPTQ